MAGFTHVHQSGKWSAIAAAWQNVHAHHSQVGSVITYTETTSHRPKPMKGQESVWLNMAPDAAAYYDMDVWSFVVARAVQIATTQYSLGDGKLNKPLHALVVVLRHNSSKRLVGFIVVHDPSAIEGIVFRDQRGRRIRYPRVKALWEGYRLTRKAKARLRHDYPGIRLVLAKDWNLDFHRAWVRTFVRGQFPAMRNAWRHVPAEGDLEAGRRLVSGSLYSAGLQTNQGSVLLPRMTGFDHRGYRTAYGFKKGNRR